MSNMTLKEVQELLDKIKQEREENKQRTDDRYINQCVAIKALAKDPRWLEANAESNRKKAQDPNWLEGNEQGRQKRLANQQWLNNVKQAAKKRGKDPKWLQANAESNRKKAQDPNWLESIKQAAKRRAQDPKWLEANRESVRRTVQTETWRKAHQEAAKKAAVKKRKRISCKGTIYDSRKGAAKELGISIGKLASLMIAYPIEYFYIDDNGNRVEPGKYKK